MSKYFQALNRISQQTKPIKRPAIEESERHQPAISQGSTEEAPLVNETIFADLRSAKRDLAYSSLLDTLRAVSVRSGVPCVVLAGVSLRSQSRRVLKGLLTQAENQGIRLLTLEVAFDGGRRFLRETSLESIEETRPILLPGQSENGETVRFESTSRSSTDQVEQWLQRVDHDFDLALIHAPTLKDSVEAALLAGETDGLMLIVENLVDSHVDLINATKKVRDAGCSLLGVVLVGAREWLPSWLSRLFKGRSQTADVNKHP